LPHQFDGKLMSGEQLKPRRPGLVIQEELRQLPPEEHLPFLALVEQRAKAASDLQMLRAIKDYREMSRSLPTSTKPPKSA
jgi:hypothetical protein